MYIIKTIVRFTDGNLFIFQHQRDDENNNTIELIIIIDYLAVFLSIIVIKTEIV